MINVRIALRTSGGRGEYEIAGSHGNLSVANVLDRQIRLQIFPNKALDTNNWIRRLQGKTRIRLGNPATDKHIYLLIAAILLMPKPKREISKNPEGQLQLTENNFSITSIQFDVVKCDALSILIQPTDLILANSNFDQARIDIVERLRIILDIWHNASLQNDSLSIEIIAHRNAVLSGDIQKIYYYATQIRNSFDIDDPLREILRKYSLIDEYTYWLGIHRNDVESSIVEEDLSDLKEAAKNRIKQWRVQASRGSKGAKFSKEVKAAYRNRCLFTGYYLPKSSFCNTSGVDAAHILPWAEYDINSVSNGLCLNKLCHWAFDTGILSLNFLKTKDVYDLSISSEAMQAEKNGLLSLEGFKQFIGKIPDSRLPSNKKFWPAPQFLEEYNSTVQFIAESPSR